MAVWYFGIFLGFQQAASLHRKRVNQPQVSAEEYNHLLPQIYKTVLQAALFGCVLNEIAITSFNYRSIESSLLIIFLNYSLKPIALIKSNYLLISKIICANESILDIGYFTTSRQSYLLPQDRYLVLMVGHILSPR